MLLLALIASKEQKKLANQCNPEEEEVKISHQFLEALVINCRLATVQITAHHQAQTSQLLLWPPKLFDQHRICTKSDIESAKK